MHLHTCCWSNLCVPVPVTPKTRVKPTYPQNSTMSEGSCDGRLELCMHPKWVTCTSKQASGVCATGQVSSGLSPESAQLQLAANASMCKSRLYSTLSVRAQVSSLTGSRWQTCYSDIVTRKSQTSVNIGAVMVTRNSQTSVNTLRRQSHYKQAEYVHILRLQFCRRSRPAPG